MPRTKYRSADKPTEKLTAKKAPLSKKQSAQQATASSVINVHAGKVLLAKFFPTEGEYIEGMDALRDMVKDFTYTAKEAKFIIFYLEDYNGKAAAVKAGYSEARSAVTAYELLRLDKIRYRIALELSEIYSRSVMSVMERKEVLTRIGRGDISEFTSLENGQLKIDLELFKTGRTKGAIKKIKTKETPTREGYVNEVEIELHDSKSAIDTLNRMEKVYEDRINIGLTLVEVDKEDQEL